MLVLINNVHHLIECKDRQKNTHHQHSKKFHSCSRVRYWWNISASSEPPILANKWRTLHGNM